MIENKLKTFLYQVSFTIELQLSLRENCGRFWPEIKSINNFNTSNVSIKLF